MAPVARPAVEQSHLRGKTPDSDFARLRESDCRTIQKREAMINHMLPPVPAPIATGYATLIAELDQVISTLEQRLSRLISCGPGCSACCQKFSVVPLEAVLIAGSTAASSPQPDSGEFCALLIDHRCSIYPERPIICRTHGVPLGYLDEAHERIEVSACPLNFPADHPFEYDDLLLLDSFNSRLAALNSAYCRTMGIGAGLRLPLA